MGGQACVFYGAAEFSRDIDFAILVSATNFSRINLVLKDLQAEVIAVPPFQAKYLRKGHAVHFRCHDQNVEGLRIDVMTKMRGVDEFDKLWRRRVTLSLEDGTKCELMSLPDLVRAKKTQRDKDWPMLRRLLENDYFNHRKDPTPGQIRFWLLEMRTPELLREAANEHPAAAMGLSRKRPLLRLMDPEQEASLRKALLEEENTEREADRKYWNPLKQELEMLRHRKSGSQ